MKIKARTGLTIGFSIYCALVIIGGCQSNGKGDTTFAGGNEYVGSTTCKSCHAEAYADWQKSDHFKAMEPANDSTVKGDFNNASFTADGVTNTFYKKDGKYFINTQGDDGQNHEYQVLYTFGFFPLQQYLIAFPGGRMQSARVSWDSRDNKWFHQYAGQKVHYEDWLHWTGNSQNWNTMCASCHSTDLRKNYDLDSDSYATTWKEMNVSCESCHGPGSNHVEYIASKQYKNGKHIKNAGLNYGRDTLPQAQLNACAACHARKTDVAQNNLHSGEILDDLIPQVISNEFYFPDGQIREEDYEYGSFTQSKMFHNNVRCANCHNPHSGELRLTGNNLCLSCHKPGYATEKHHFHKEGSEGAQCINCHMVARTYMGVDHRRDHSFRVPRPDQSVKYGTPNACTTCHKDKTPLWAAEMVRQWYGPERKYHFSDDLVPGSLLDDQSEKHLVKLLADTTQPEIARATAANYLGAIQSMKSAQALLQALNDKKALVRYHSLRSLENFPPEVWQQKAYHALSDKIRAVRVAAADLYHRYSPDLIPASARLAFDSADAENVAFLLNQTDFAVGNVMMADYKMQGGAYQEAIRYYRRGLDKDSLMNYARLNLAAAYNTIGQNRQALQTLQDASVIDPFNDQVWYNLGLLYYEMEEIPLALESFQKAVQLGSANPGLYYNYGLLLQQTGKASNAEEVLLKGFKLAPDAANINYALAFYYIQSNQTVKSRQYVQNLYNLDPENPDYQEMFRNLGL